MVKNLYTYKYKEAQTNNQTNDIIDSEVEQDLTNVELDQSEQDQSINNLIGQINQQKQKNPEESIQQYMAEENIDQDQAKIEEMKNQGQISITAPPEETGIIQEPEKKQDWLTDIGEIEKAITEAINAQTTLEIVYKVVGQRGRERRLRKDIKLIERRNKGKTRWSPGYTIVIHRIVEPHFEFIAGNGNKILLTWDRSIGDIRGFIISQIEKCKPRDKKFRDRKGIKKPPRTIKEPDQGKNDMEHITDKLNNIASKLENKKLVKTAGVVKSAISSLKEIKISQYVGIQGYWLRNKRCWDNCYRQKRTSKPKMPAQEVWGECWEEYLEALKDDNSGWEKYASETEQARDIDKKTFREINTKFLEAVEKNIKEEGFSLPESIYLTIEAQSYDNEKKIISANKDLIDIAVSLKEAGHSEGEEIAGLCNEIIKEADFGGKWWQKAINFFRTPVGQIAKRVKYMIQRANQVIAPLSGQAAPTAATPPATPPTAPTAATPPTAPPTPPTAPPTAPTAPTAATPPTAPTAPTAATPPTAAPTAAPLTDDEKEGEINSSDPTKVENKRIGDEVKDVLEKHTPRKRKPKASAFNLSQIKSAQIQPNANSPVQVYNKFVRDLIDEMGFIKELSLKDSKMQPIANSLLGSMQQFIDNHNKQQKGKTSIDPAFIVKNINSLISSLTIGEKQLTKNAPKQTTDQGANQGSANQKEQSEVKGDAKQQEDKLMTGSPPLTMNDVTDLAMLRSNPEYKNRFIIDLAYLNKLGTELEKDKASAPAQTASPVQSAAPVAKGSRGKNKTK